VSLSGVQKQGVMVVQDRGGPDRDMYESLEGVD
jgi:hypothetical protein